MEKYGTARRITGDSIIRRMRIACWITEATDTHAEYVMLLVFTRQRGYTKAYVYTYIAYLVFFCSLLPFLTYCLFVKVIARRY